ncbi:hypothetical protein Tco_0266303 [Tanacetum coccineum]
MYGARENGTTTGVKVVPSEVVVDKDDETLVLVFDAALGVGDGVLEIKFSGVLNEHMKGFYKGYNLYLELCIYKFLDPYADEPWNIGLVIYIESISNMTTQSDKLGLQIYFIEIIVRLRKGRRWWLMIMDLFLRRLSLATTTVCEEFSDVSHQSPERFITALITKTSTEAFTQLPRMGAREITGCSGRVKDYVMECIGSEIKQRPKSEWITADASSTAVQTGKSEKKKSKKRLDWWMSLDEEKNKKKNKKKQGRESSTHNLNNNNWWQKDDEMYGDNRKKKRSRSTSRGSRGSIDWWLDGFSEKCDVHSFGVLLLVVIAGRRPLQVGGSPMSEFQRANLLSWAHHLARLGKLIDLADHSTRNKL